jgi:hypothetical protein
MHALLAESEDVFHTDPGLRVLAVDCLLPFADFLPLDASLDYTVFHIVLTHNPFHALPDLRVVRM